MIDVAARRLLSQDVRRLVTGRMTNDQFDDVYYDQYAESHDRAVAGISSFCYSLYSSDLPLACSLRGRYAVDAETRRAAARCVLFLLSGREYGWPQFPDDPVIRSIAGIAGFIGIPAGAALALIGLTMVADGWDNVVGCLTIFGLALLIASVAFWCFWPTFLRDDWQAFYRAGEYDVWPFSRTEDYDRAGKCCHLLGHGAVHSHR
jgi:hypothetical protein